MTVMFCDLVGSSAIAAELDPEEFATLLIAYRERCAAAVAQRGGYIARYAGDGVLACFGYPRAIGRDAQAAVACGLAIAREMERFGRSLRMPGDRQLAVRIGIETGVVLAGRLGHETIMEIDGLVGTAPNTAARLQEVADPNSVVIGETAHELVAEDFLCEAVPAERLSGLRLSAPAFVVRGTAGRGEHDLVLARPRRAPLVGRVEELGAISRAWSQSCLGQGHTVLISGEAGIGKSRLVQDSVSLVAGTPHKAIVIACTPPTAGIAFHPAVEALRGELAASAMRGGSEEQALQALLHDIGFDDGPELALLSEALGWGTGRPDLAPPARRRILMRTLQAWLLQEAASRPLLLVAEDLHWSDPSTLELLHDVTDFIVARPAMLLATYRSDVTLSWPDRPTTLKLTLPPLSANEAEQLLDSLHRSYVAETRELILSRSDGVPLFLEEFARAAGTTTVPRTLQQLFTARLDGLGEAKRLAQCAAILEPHLEPDLLAALAGVHETTVGAWITRLVEAEIFVRTTPPPSESFGFRHALLRDAAGESLLRAEQRALHASAAMLLAQLRPSLAERQPELIAEHYAHADDFASALPLYIRAAQRSLAGAALTEAEAEAHIARGLAAVAVLSGGRGTEAELELRVLLGQVLIARRGYASEAVQSAFESALAVAETVPDQVQSLSALRGLASFYQVRGPLSRAQAICERLVATAERVGDDRLCADAWRRRGWNRGCMGHLVDAQEDLERSLAAYDPDCRSEYIAVAGHDTQVLALSNLCWFDALTRGATEASLRARAAVAAARTSPHPVSACYGFVLSALVLQQAGCFEEALDLAQTAHHLAEEKGFAYWMALSEVAIGSHEVLRGGTPERGRERILRGLASYRETQGELLRPVILSRLAEAEIVLHDDRAARAAIEEATDVAAALEAWGFLPELWLKQALLASTSRSQRLVLLARARGAAREQGAHAIADAAEAAGAS